MLLSVLRSIMLSLWILATFVHHWVVPISHNDDGLLLYLTPMIQARRIDEARNACKVEIPEKVTIESYSGYLTVDKLHGSNLFFWFFPATNNATDAPVLLWLQGGPGVSSLYGLFEENGPFSVSKSKTLVPRNHTWVSTHSMLYIDNPVGTGFSFTTEGGYNKNQLEVSNNMYEALLQFFTLFPEYQKNDFYIAGESYAGKYIPAVSRAIHLKNPSASTKINLKGMAIGNGFIDPINQVVYGETLYQFGIIDEHGKREFELQENMAKMLINQRNYSAAAVVDYRIHSGEESPFCELTGLASVYNVLWDAVISEYWNAYVSDPVMRAALHVGERSFNNGNKVFSCLFEDVMQTMSPWLSTLLDTGLYRVLLYSGQLDMLVSYRGTMNMARSLKWSGAEHFMNAKRTIWRVRDSEKNITDVAGYATSFGPLTVLMVRNAGHMVTIDQPTWAYEIINRFTSGKPF